MALRICLQTYMFAPPLSLPRRLPRPLQEGFGFRTITGSMPLKQRARAIEAFQHDAPTCVLAGFFFACLWLAQAFVSLLVSDGHAGGQVCCGIAYRCTAVPLCCVSPYIRFSPGGYSLAIHSCRHLSHAKRR